MFWAGRGHSLPPASQKAASMLAFSVFAFCLYAGEGKVVFHLFYLLFYKGTLSLLGQFNWPPKQPALLTQVYCCSIAVFPFGIGGLQS